MAYLTKYKYKNIGTCRSVGSFSTGTATGTATGTGTFAAGFAGDLVQQQKGYYIPFNGDVPKAFVDHNKISQQKSFVAANIMSGWMSFNDDERDEVEPLIEKKYNPSPYSEY